MPAPLGPTSAIDLTGRYREIDLSQHLARLFCVGIVEADSLEAHLTSDRRQLDGIRIILHLGRRVQQLEDPLARAQRALELAVEPCETGHG